MGALRAPVAAHAHVQDRGAPPAGLVRQAPDHRVTSLALASAASTPPVLTSNPASQHCMVWPHALARHFQAQVIQARERAQVRAIKDSIGHVEVFQMDGVAISIIGRPRPLPGHDTPNPAHNTYTLKCEEPVTRTFGRHADEREGRKPRNEIERFAQTQPVRERGPSTRAATSWTTPSSTSKASPDSPRRTVDRASVSGLRLAPFIRPASRALSTGVHAGAPVSTAPPFCVVAALSAEQHCRL